MLFVIVASVYEVVSINFPCAILDKLFVTVPHAKNEVFFAINGFIISMTTSVVPALSALETYQTEVLVNPVF